MRPEDYRSKGCNLAKDMYEIFRGIWEYQNGNPCKGCAEFHECKLRKEIYEARNKPRPSSSASNSMKDGITNADIARVLGISKRQAAKKRARGELDLDDIKRRL